MNLDQINCEILACVTNRISYCLRATSRIPQVLGHSNIRLVALKRCDILYLYECHLSGRHLSEHVGYPTVVSSK